MLTRDLCKLQFSSSGWGDGMRNCFGVKPNYSRGLIVLGLGCDKISNACLQGEWDKAMGLFTEAIKLNPNSAAMFAKRGTCFLKLSPPAPRACVRDCSRAIELNPDNAAAYKFRGRANR